MTIVLQTNKLESWYGDAQALYGIDFVLQEGELVAMIGANGAGKSTFLKCITGLVSVPSQAILWKSKPIGGLTPSKIVQLGVAMVPEGRRLFPSLSVEENLLIGSSAKRKGPWNLSRVYELFPVLKERSHHPGTALSGGQQQMVAIGRALMSNPEVLLCDELSLGLAPVVVREIYDIMPLIAAEGMSVIVVEQDVSRAQHVSQRLYCLQEGRVKLQGNSAELSKEAIRQAYFGA